jgi:alcohol dehydrogenase, propanol-preferring
MRALQLVAPGRVELRDVDRPAPGAGEAVLRVLAAGVCRTDLALRRSGAGRMPLTLGHEIVGEVAELGAGVTAARVDATVAVYELIGCGACRACRRGEDNLCREAPPEVPGVTRDGGMADYVVVPARNLVEVTGVDAVQAAPLTDAGMTALHAVERARPWLAPDGIAVVIGVGGLGHLALQFIAATSDVRLIAVDVEPSRLELAARLGATDGVRAGEGAAAAILATGAGHSVDVVLDFVGSQESLDLAARVVGRGGAIVVTGGGGGSLCITAAMGAGRAPDREVTMVHTFGGTRADLVRALELARVGRVESRVQRFGLEDAGRALDALEAGRIVGRAVIVP